MKKEVIFNGSYGWFWRIEGENFSKESDKWFGTKEEAEKDLNKQLTADTPH